MELNDERLTKEGLFVTHDIKAKIIELIIIIISTIAMIILLIYFLSKGSKTLVFLSTCIPGTTIGLYILFGKYVYLYGLVITKQLRTWVGLSFLLVMPVVWLVFYMNGRLE
jgi:hypothetical protein